MKQMIEVADSFDLSPFYEREEKIVILTEEITYRSLWEEGYFLFDILCKVNGKSPLLLPPWQNKRGLVEDMLVMWEKEGLPALQKYFKIRDGKNAQPLMLKYTSIYIQTNVWLSHSSVTSLQDIGDELEKLSYAPMNVKDRIEFILHSPSHYHSFVTLTQLFAESRKKWAVYLK